MYMTSVHVFIVVLINVNVHVNGKTLLNIPLEGTFICKSRLKSVEEREV